MMMAHDSSPRDSGLADDTIDAVRSALVAYIQTPSQGEALHAALHALAREARDRSILPEKLLIALKEIWYGLPSVQRMKEQDERLQLLQRVVTMCIKEYYRV